jgi:trk system potassium uptake protein TrkH
MLNLRPILFLIGIFTCIMGMGMLLTMLVDVYYNDDNWVHLLQSAAVTLFFGGIMAMSCATDKLGMTINRRQGFLMITLAWVALCLFGALPFIFSHSLDVTNAIFESVSGITTTGSTVITNLQNEAPSILFWRSLLQWFGGIGVVVMALSIMPFLKIGGMQLFETELSENEKALPRATSLAASITLIYLVLTMLCVASYYINGMSMFNAINHAMTTISTGGFSTFDTSFIDLDDFGLKLTGIIFMICGGLPFVLYLKLSKGDYEPFLEDTQVRLFFIILATVIAVITTNLLLTTNMAFIPSLIDVSFNVVSMLTGTGFASDDYDKWGTLPVTILFFIMFIGACAGSTSCGIKIFRFQILGAICKVQLKRLLYPNGVFVPYYNNHPIPDGVPASVMGFFFIFALTFALTVLSLSWVGLDFMSAISGAATAITNVGPGLGNLIGPTGNFAPLSDSAKWILSVAMLLGRLEILTVLVLFTRHFWRK